MVYRTDWFQGIFPALVTPFSSGGGVDEDACRALIRFVLPHVDGVVPCGTTGEFSYMTLEERQQTIDICVDEVDGRVPVLAGTGCTTTRDTVALTSWAQDVGADGALVVAPYFLKPSFNEVYDHFRAVDRVGLPIVMYNIPQCAGTHFKWWTAEAGLLDFDNTIGVKDSSGDIPFMGALFEKVKGKVSVFVGHDEVVQAALGAGADGAILASANLIPDVWQKVYRATKAGDFATAQDWQQRVQRLVRIVVRCGSTQACKEGLRMMGVDVGDSRHPIVPGGAFRREDREELRLQLESLGKIRRAPVVYDLGGKQVGTDVFATPQTPRTIAGWTMRVGEGFAGPPFQELAHVDLLIGLKNGPVGRAIERSVAQWGEERRLQVIRERPSTLLVPTVTIRTDRQRRLFERAAAGVKLAIDLSIEDGFLPEPILDDVALVVNAFVHPAASIAKRVEFNNYKATRHAIRKAVEGRPTVDELIAEKAAARHPFRYAP
ncbi:MAG: dihydrodipicolinate synthase family protein [Anaerolineae bacterium]|jgi:4-hydroxy-tetrahydrodipicolinate synthase